MEGSHLDGRTPHIEQILDFVRNHPESYASLAVCRRALDRGLDAVTPETLKRLAGHLEQAPTEEVEAYLDIVG
ncbi:hypothetical protein [Limnochorda pilosa]|uniref:hypothetical protein n=1 Tax=Limnochorda pilosa TaxID=1555112 RepID=UPI00082D8159|nr:hypothetical protein [Limnochorda pilosa]